MDIFNSTSTLISMNVSSTSLPIAVLAIWAASCFLRGRTLRHKYFPSPPSDPIWGHLRIMPPDYQWQTFAEWGKRLGDVIYLSIVGRPMIVLNTAEAARDLLDKRSPNYTDRPPTILHGEMINAGNMLAFLRYGDQFRLQRRLVQQYLNSDTVTTQHPLQMEQSRILIKNLLLSPEEFWRHIQKMSAANVVKLTYGHDVVSDDDKFISLAVDSVVRFVAAGTPCMTPVDIFPILRYVPSWFPGAKCKKDVKLARKALNDMVNISFKIVKEERVAGTAQPSLVNNWLDDYESSQAIDEYHEMNIKYAAATMYGAGVDTSDVTVVTFVLMMTHHPEVAQRAQAEIDKVTGAERLPTLDDRSMLPYVDCILKEVFRINPPVPLGIPHQSMKEDVYRDKTVPAGTVIVPNIWQMMRDERYFPEPENFIPERFLNKVTQAHNGHRGSGSSSIHALNKFNVDDPSSLVFGFGRRICPGRFFADASAWLAISNILAVFNILPPIDPDTGREARPCVEYTSGFTSKPKPFKCRFVPRSEKHVSLINQD